MIYIELTVDASYFPNGSGVAAAVIRNHGGEAMAGAAWI